MLIIELSIDYEKNLNRLKISLIKSKGKSPISGKYDNRDIEHWNSIEYWSVLTQGMNHYDAIKMPTIFYRHILKGNTQANKYDLYRSNLFVFLYLEFLIYCTAANCLGSNLAITN